MKQLLLVFAVLFLFSCNDGNQDVPDFNFADANIQICGNGNKIVIYKIVDNEAIAIGLDNSQINDSLFVNEQILQPITLSKSGTNTIVYRTFDDNPGSSYFCSDIPPVSPLAISEWTGDGKLEIDVKIEKQDDNDGVAAEDEDLNGNGDYTDDDTDGDGIPNYIDIDDDGDGIPTITEIKYDDTNNDGTPDYLDSNDDGDSVDTIWESDSEDDDGDGIPNYRDADSSTPMAAERTLPKNTHTIYYTTAIIIDNLTWTKSNGDIVRYDLFDGFGSYQDSKKVEDNYEN